VIALYLDDPLQKRDWQEIQAACREPVEALRIPWLKSASESPHQSGDPRLVLPHLRRLQLDKQQGRRVLLVAPLDLHWCQGLTEAIREVTGAYPLLIQTERHREMVGIPGPMRIIDMEAYYTDGDSNQIPPWQQA
jgi:hypothetical protein